MSIIKGISRLIRLPNLIMVVLTMYIMRWSIVRPILDLMGFEPEMPEWSFALLVLSTLLITAAGNVINDFHDVRADRVNNPGRVVIDSLVSRRQAIFAHFMLNSIGVVIGVFVSFFHKIEWLSLIFLAVPVLLWSYSLTLKHLPLLGNLTISILTGNVPLLVLLFEYPLLTRAHADALILEPQLFSPVLYWIIAFSIFAFLTNLIRELIKDGQDIPGDSEVGSKTIAIKMGIGALKWLIIILSFLTVILLGLIFLLFLPDWISLVYFIVFLALPFIVLLFKLVKVNSSADFKPVSSLVKLIMFFGILYAPIAYFIMQSFIA